MALCRHLRGCYSAACSHGWRALCVPWHRSVARHSISQGGPVLQQPAAPSSLIRHVSVFGRDRRSCGRCQRRGRFDRTLELAGSLPRTHCHSLPVRRARRWRSCELSKVEQPTPAGLGIMQQEQGSEPRRAVSEKCPRTGDETCRIKAIADVAMWCVFLGLVGCLWLRSRPELPS